jgi:UDP-N-acetylglucosamine acyltransferase
VRPNVVHPTAVIGRRALLGEGNVVGPFVVITSSARIGNGNWIGAHSVIGAPPEHREHIHPSDWGLEGPDTDAGCLIGDSNIIREAVVIQAGRLAATRIGNHAFLMANAYIAHDCVVEDYVTLSASVALAGHARVQIGANLGIGSSVRQHVSIGMGAMVGMGSVVTKDTPSCALLIGVPARVQGANRIGLMRAGLDPDEVDVIDRHLTASDDGSGRSVTKKEREFGVLESKFREGIIALARA